MWSEFKKKKRPWVLKVKVIPGSPRKGLKGKMSDGTLKIELKAPPEKGKANKELITYLARELSVAKDQIKILKGEKIRTKILEIS